MKRSPKVSDAQLKNLRAVSHVQAKTEAALTGARKHSIAIEAESIRLRERRAAQREHWEQYGHWWARVGLVFFGALSVVLVSAVVMALWSGETIAFQRYQRTPVARQGEPLGYWIAISAHSAVASCVVWLAAKLVRPAKLLGKNAT